MAIRDGKWYQYRATGHHIYNNKDFSFNILSTHKLLDKTVKRRLMEIYDLSGVNNLKIVYIDIKIIPDLLITDSPYFIFAKRK